MHKLQQCPQRSSTRWIAIGLGTAVSAGVGMLFGLLTVFYVDLPQVHDLGHYRPISNTVLYDDSGRPFASFALQRRTIANYEDFPKVLYDAVLSVEDKNFENHPGFEVWRMLAAAHRDLQLGGNFQGASTLTMQLARNLFLSRERTYSRKFRELLLAIQIEREFTKPQIFTLYANQIYLGHGVYGFASGSEYYFGRPASDLTLEEAAMLAALPKAPNIYSPIKNPERALQRRNLVIDAMLATGKIAPSEAATAKNRPIRLHIHDDKGSLAPYFAEEIRRYLEKQYGTEQVHEDGLRVYTTLNLDLQRAANRALLDGLAAYEHRHGWHSHLQNIRANPDIDGQGSLRLSDSQLEAGDYTHAEVVSVSPSAAVLKLGMYTSVIGAADISWTNRMLSQLLSPGDLAYVKILSLSRDFRARVRLEQDSGLQGALLAIDTNGEVKAMVGGRDFNRSKFNRATQALRQAGSTFKPYVYTAAIEQGAMPDDTVVDAPETFLTPSGPYTPRNYDGKFEGAITLKHALAESRNIPAVKLAQVLGMRTVLGYVRRFGISERIPTYLPVALGAADLTLMEQTSAFSVFPNDGLRPIPHYVIKVTDHDGRVLEQNYPMVEDVISRSTARVMTWMLREVVLHGTATAANRLKLPVAGKTGTTNDFTDAWFIGFSPSITCGVWVGFDERITLGKKETGARAALPIWIDFMDTALLQQASNRDFPTPLERMNRVTAVAAGNLSTGPSTGLAQETTSGPAALPARPASKHSHDSVFATQ